MISLSEKDFQKETNDGNCFVQFSASWCGPCKVLTKTIETSVEENFKNMKFYKINIEDCSNEFLESFAVKSVHKVFLLSNGTPKNDFIGSKSSEKITDIINTTFGE